MAKCKTCKALILFGGKEHEGKRYCNDACLQAGITDSYREDIPDEVVDQLAWQLRGEACAVCGGEGPNEYHSAWSVYSFVVMTIHKQQYVFGCRSCGRKHQIKYLLFSGVAGWWGFPWGILLTPFLTIANLIGIFRGTPDAPSDQLRETAQLFIAGELQRRVESDDENEREMPTPTITDR